MFCKHCGNELKENANYCQYCGNKIELIVENTSSENKTPEEDVIVNKNETITFIETATDNSKKIKKKEFDKEELISILFGISSLIVAPYINIFSIPMSISGIIFGAFSKTKFKKKFSVGKIINYVSITIAIISFIFVCTFFSKAMNNTEYLFHHMDNENSTIQTIEKNTDNEFVEEINIEIPKQEMEEQEITKNLNVVQYTITGKWNFTGMQQIDTNNTSMVMHTYSYNDAILILREMNPDVFSTVEFESYIISNYGNIISKTHLEQNNGNIWTVLETEEFNFENNNYSTKILYTYINDSVVIIEISNTTLNDYTNEISNLINTIS